MNVLLHGTRVTLVPASKGERGTILGYTTYIRNGAALFGYVVELDQGAWLRNDEYGDRMYISTVVVHCDGVEVLE